MTMFGLKLVTRDYLEDLERDLQRCEHALVYRDHKINKAKQVLAKITAESKSINKNEIVAMLKELLKEMR